MGFFYTWDFNQSKVVIIFKPGIICLYHACCLVTDIIVYKDQMKLSQIIDIYQLHT